MAIENFNPMFKINQDTIKLSFLFITKTQAARFDLKFKSNLRSNKLC